MATSDQRSGSAGMRCSHTRTPGAVIERVRSIRRYVVWNIDKTAMSTKEWQECVGGDEIQRQRMTVGVYH